MNKNKIQGVRERKKASFAASTRLTKYISRFWFNKCSKFCAKEKEYDSVIIKMNNKPSIDIFPFPSRST
jgi:hypothetical protein